MKGREKDVKSFWPWIGLGYRRVTMEITKRNDGASRSQAAKNFLSTDCSLKLESMKMESSVIADQHAAVNLLHSPVHTARHGSEAGLC
jgi:hypothetical protein